MAEQQQVAEVSIEDLQLSLEVYEIEGEEKVRKLKDLFKEKQRVDLGKMFYEDKSSLEIKFQNIIGDLTEFLIKQETASTDKLRKTFYRLLENPLTFLFKVSRFQIFNLRLNAFDIELQPIEAVCQLGTSILANIDKHEAILSKMTTKYDGNEYSCYEQFEEQAQSRLIQDLIFIFYSYLRKGGNIIRKKFEEKVRVVELYNQIQAKLIKGSIERQDAKTLKELSLLNYEIYLLEPSYDVLCFFLKVPLKKVFSDVFRELETLGEKAKQNSNYNLFILIYLRYTKEILAKLQLEGIDEEYSSYIENGLLALLDLWGCRLCYYQEFYDLFGRLLSLHPKKASALESCLKYNPELKKDDIVLLRTNFKHDLLQKQSELLSLLRQKSMDDINNALSSLFHQTLYTLDFSAFSREELLNLLTLLNKSPSLGQFFGIVERAFKQWNHSIDFFNPHKFIAGEFKYPTIDEQKIAESLRLLNNLCILEGKSQKDFEQLVKAGSIQKVFIGFATYLFSNEKTVQLISESRLLKELLVNILQFLKRAIVNASDWEPACLLYSSHLLKFSSEESSKVAEILRQILNDNFSAFTVQNLLAVFKHMVKGEKELKVSQDGTFNCLINNCFRGVQTKNEQVKNFRFFDSSLKQGTKITSSESAFLQKYACLNNGIIQPKDSGCFTLSELEVITNPVQFEKVMDNYYFGLDKNTKHFVQELTLDWIRSDSAQLPATVSIVKEVINKYPITIPLLCSTRISIGNLSSRFVEFISKTVSEASFPILKQIVECRCIRFKNGKDYVREEILPLILKETIKAINEGSHKVEHLELLALSLSHTSLSEIKTDLIQNSIDAIKHEISQSTSENKAFRLSRAHCQVLGVFFEKKQRDMRKNGLKSIFQGQIWHQNRIKSSSLQNQNKAASLKKVNINQQIMISPFTATHDFETNAKLEKTPLNKQKTSQKSEIDLSSLKSFLPESKGVNLNIGTQKKIQSLTTVDCSKLKYDIESHLGPEIVKFCRKEGYQLLTSASKNEEQTENNQQNVTFVQYYLKEFQVPQVSAELVFAYLLSMLKSEIQYSTLFSNLINVEKLFSSMILVLGHCSKKLQLPESQATVIDQLLGLNGDNRIATQKAILNIFSDIGYTNLWAQSYNSLKQLDYLAQLRQKCAFKQEAEEQTFLSWILKICLEEGQVHEELNKLLGSIFSSRPKDQSALMYKVSLDRGLLNLIMKSLNIANLSYVSLLFHSNYNNLRLYTDQLHEGLKALNMASKNRAYNEYVQLSKDLEDEEFYQPMQLFKQNFHFFISIESQGYRFKKAQQQKIGRQRVLKVLRNGTTGDKLNSQLEKVVEQFDLQLAKLQHNIASRVKAFYLATKLRDLSYQNSTTICLLYEILSETGKNKEEILEKVNCIELFSLMMRLYNSLVLFDHPQDCSGFLQQDQSTAQKQVCFCTTRRYSHSISNIYEEIQLQLDEVIQRCIDGLKYFFTAALGKQWLAGIKASPSFLSKSFLPSSGPPLPAKIRDNVGRQCSGAQPAELSSPDTNSYSNIVKGLRELKKSQILSGNVKINFGGKLYSLPEFLAPLKDHLIKSQTFVKSKDGFLLFNKYKTSEKTLEELELLGVIVGFCIFSNKNMDLPLHSSLLAAIGFGMCDLQDLLDVDFKIWEDLRTVMSATDSKTLNLNFSYTFESLQTLKPERVELVDKGTSKKVNNLNREEYCDLVCCHLLYKAVGRQLRRFLESICYVCPKQLLSSLQISQLHKLFIEKHPKYSTQILRNHMRKRGLVLPDTVLSKGKRVQNLKDYQSVQWLSQLTEENKPLKEKLWKDETNIFVCTWMGQGVEFDSSTSLLLLGRLKDKEELKSALLSLK